ncbi:MAG: hypothetical protein IKW21_01185 [Lachnospiraceae bacterium]|nr:hypothetical protein [Lachnospiraceae bacterium]
MKLTRFDEKSNTLYINSDAITKEFTTEYMGKPYAERIAESPYRDRINEELAKHEGCKIGEFCEG